MIGCRLTSPFVDRNIFWPRTYDLGRCTVFSVMKEVQGTVCTVCTFFRQTCRNIFWPRTGMFGPVSACLLLNLSVSDIIFVLSWSSSWYCMLTPLWNNINLVSVIINIVVGSIFELYKKRNLGPTIQTIDYHARVWCIGEEHVRNIMNILIGTQRAWYYVSKLRSLFEVRNMLVWYHYYFMHSNNTARDKMGESDSRRISNRRCIGWY